jgi:carboxypeptidase C (cathepsin A)
VTIFERILMSKPGINVYDIRKTCDGPLCYDFSDADAFLNSRHVRDVLGVGDRRWEECNMDVHSHFMGEGARWRHARC